jgi:hypothetical protein
MTGRVPVFRTSPPAIASPRVDRTPARPDRHPGGHVAARLAARRSPDGR